MRWASSFFLKSARNFTEKNENCEIAHRSGRAHTAAGVKNRRADEVAEALLWQGSAIMKRRGRGGGGEGGGAAGGGGGPQGE